MFAINGLSTAQVDNFKMEIYKSTGVQHLTVMMINTTLGITASPKILASRTFDDEGRIIYYTEGNNHRNAQSFAYDGKGRLITDYMDGYLKWKWIYNKEGQLIFKEINTDRKGRFMPESEHKYYENGQLQSIIHYSYENGKQARIKSDSFSMDGALGWVEDILYNESIKKYFGENGELVKEEMQGKTDDDTREETRIYKYDRNNRKTGYKLFEKDLNSPVEQRTYKYNDSGYLILEEIGDNEGNTIGIKYDYSFYPDGLLKEKTETIKAKDSKTVFTYYYDNQEDE